jgi:hypothetical protein
MLVNAAGRERTQKEFEKLLERVGLKLQKIIPTDSALFMREPVGEAPHRQGGIPMT